MEIRNKINEKNFNLEIYEWDDLTLDILKAYSDWKCNGNQASKTIPITIGKRSEKETEDTVKINVNKPIEPETEKEETKIGRPEIPINVQEEILRLHKNHRSQKFIINDIKTRFGLKISRNSVTKYREKKEIDGQIGNKEFTKIKKKPNIKNIH